MFRWLTILAALALAIGVAYGQSSPPSQPTLPLGQARPMMNAPMMNDGMMEFDPRMAPMMEMMRMMGGPGMMDQGMMNWGMMASQGMMGSMCHAQMDQQAGAPASYLEARLAFAKSELAISGAQEPAWQAYAGALRRQVQPMSAHMASMHQAMMGSTTFPEKFEARISFLESQIDGLKAVRDAAAKLYGKLDAAQHEKADRLLPLSLCM